MGITKLLFFCVISLVLQTYNAEYIKREGGQGDVGIYYATDDCLQIFDHSEKYSCEDGTPGKIEIYSDLDCQGTPTSADCVGCACVDTIGKGNELSVYTDKECKEPSMTMIVKNDECITIKSDDEGDGGMSILPSFKENTAEIKLYTASGKCSSESTPLEINAELDKCIEITGHGSYLKASSDSPKEPSNNGEISHRSAGLLLIDLLAILFL